MAQYDGSIRINTQINTSGVNKGVAAIGKSFAWILQGASRVNNSFDGLSNTVRKLGFTIAAAFSARALAQFGKETVEAASGLEAMESQFSQVFGELEETASKSLSKVAGQAGVVEDRMKASFTKIAAFAKTTGMDTAESVALSERAMVAVADSAAFYDRSLEETTETLQSFLKGNYENDAALGLSATETTRNAAANKLYGKSFIDLSESQKQLTLLQMVEDANKLSGAMGQAAREADTWTNQVGNLKQAWTGLMANIGKLVLPVAIQAVKLITNVINSLSAMIAKLSAAAGAFRSFSELLTGNKSKAGASIGAGGDNAQDMSDGYNSAADGAENLANATEKAAEETKKAEKAAEGYLSPLDEINKLGKEENKQEAESAPETGEPVKGLDYGELAKGKTAVDELSDRMSALYDLLKRKDWEGLGRAMADGINKGLQKIYDAINWSNVGPKITKFVDAFTRTFNSLVDNIDWDLLGRTIGAGINTLVNTFNLLIGEGGIDFANLGRKLSVGLRGMIGEINWTNLGNLFGNYFMVSWRMLSGFAEDMSRKSDAGLTGWAELGIAIGQAVNGVFEKIDFGTIGTTLALGFNGAFETLKNVALTVDWDGIAVNIYTGINNLIHGINWAEAGESLSLFVTKLLGTFREVAENTDWEGFGRGIGEFLSGIDWGTILGDVFAILKEVIFGLIEGLGQTTAGKFILAFAGLSLALKGITVTAGIINSWKALHSTFKLLVPAVTNLAGGIKTLMSGGLLSGTGLISKLANAFALAAGGAGTLNEAFVAIFGTAGTLVAGIASTVLGAVLAVTNFFSMLKEGFSWLKEILMVIGIALAAVGAVILGAPAAVAAAVAGIVAAVATLVVVVKEHWDSICEFFSGAAEWFNTNVIQPIAAFFQGLWKSVSEFFSNLWDDIKGVWEKVSTWFNDTVITPVVNFFQGLWTRVKQIFEGLWIIVQAVWIVASTWFNEKVITPVVGFFKSLWEKVSGFFSKLWDGIKEIWSKVSAWFNDNVITPVVGFFKGVWTNVSGYFSSLWKDVKGVWEKVSGWFSRTVIDPVKSAWKTATDAIAGFFSGLWKGIANGVVGAMNAVIGAIESGINFIVRGINFMLGGFDSIVSWAADIVGVSWGGVSLVPEVSLSRIPIPHLAQGTVVPPNKEFMAVLGDNKREPEVVSPISTIEQAVKNAMSEMGGGFREKEITIRIPVYIGNKQVYEAVVDYGKIRQAATGKNDFMLGAT